LSLIAELKRRSVFKVGAAYLVVGWLVIQVAATVFPSFGIPDWAFRLVVLAIALGFPVALVLAWAFELTSDGIKVESAGVGTKRMYTFAAVLAALAVGWFMRGGVGGGAGFEAPLGPHSTAVLPFVNMSSDKENEYFSDGLTETLLHKLAQVPELKVAARTSSFAFKGKQEDIRAIGRELGVATVMEGSVQRSGDTLRITAQLVRTDDGSHIWSINYDRKLADLFAIQDEIAGAVTAALVGALVPEAKAAIAKGGTQNLEAYDLYSKSLAPRMTASFTSLSEADALLTQALEKDPKYVDAMLAHCYTWVAMMTTGSITVPEAQKRIDAMLDRIEAIEPGNGGLLGLRAVRANQRGEREAALALYERAIAASPSDSSLLVYYANALDLSKQSEGAKALEIIQRAVALDPLNAVVLYTQVAIFQGLKRADEAFVAANKLVQVAPQSPIGYQVRAGLQSDRGRWADEFVDWRRSQLYDPTDYELAAEIALQLDKLGDRAHADAWLGKSSAIAPGNFYPLSMKAHLAFRRGDMATAYATALPLLGLHASDRRGNWGRVSTEGCFAALALGKRDEVRAALLATGLYPRGFSEAAIKAASTDAFNARHILGHVASLLPCLLDAGAAGQAQRAELAAAAATLVGDDWKDDSPRWRWLKATLEGDESKVATAWVADLPTTGDIVQFEAWADWGGVAGDPAVRKALDAERAKLAAESARLPKAMADAGVSASP
jgi:TolB-like protein/Flp pilus assembly protein TadD